jgi:DNA invertase Pin-like site-specific DNA recombinase
MAVYGYARVSTDRQVTEGESLNVQRRQIEGQAMTLGLPVTEIFIEEGVSGATPFGKRPQGERLLWTIQPGDTVITPKLDRMFRSSVDALNVLHQFQALGASLYMIDMGGDVTGNGISKLVFTILSAVAEAERDRIRERIADVKKDQKRRGRYLGGRRPPFGYRVNEAGALEEVSEEMIAISQMKEMAIRGKSLREIAAALNGEGFQITHATVGNVLKRYAP